MRGILPLGGLLLAVMCSPVWAEQPLGFVFNQLGAVDLERAGQTRRLHRGDELAPGDRIVTETDSRVLIELNDGSTLALGGESALRLTALTFDRDAQGTNGEITLERGILRATLSHRDWPRLFRVATPSAALLSAGAQWIIETGEAGTAVFVLKGEVEVGGAGMLKRVVADQGIEVPPGDLPSQPAPWGQARIERVIARTNVP